MRILTALLIFNISLIPCYLHSQDLIKDGIIVLRDGQILTGQVRCTNWSRTPQRILFRSKGQALFAEYGPNEVEFFEAGNQRYWRSETWVDHRPVDYDLDPDAILPQNRVRLEKDTVFLKCIVGGTKYDLLELVDNSKSHYYLKDMSGAITLLEYKVFSTKPQTVEIFYGFRRTLIEINRKELNDPVIEAAARECFYDDISLSRIVEAINKSSGKVQYNIPVESRKRIISFFAGPAAGVTLSLPKKDRGLIRGNGSIAGIVAGFDLSMGYSCNGGESAFRFDVLFARMRYEANSSEPEKRSLYESLQYNIVPSIQIRFPLFTLENIQSHIGGGFKTPIHLSEQQRVNMWKATSSDDEFPWVAITVGGQLDFQIKKRWEIGVAGYQAPSVDFAGSYYEPMHFYVWVAHRF